MNDIRAAVSITSDGACYDEIDYSTETGPFFYVYMDDTPILPERPLPLERAISLFRQEVKDAQEFGGVVELRSCTSEDLEWAGIKPGTERGWVADA